MPTVNKLKAAQRTTRKSLTGLILDDFQTAKKQVIQKRRCHQPLLKIDAIPNPRVPKKRSCGAIQ